MRVAIVSDIHGNLTAFDAVLADLRVVSPDLVLHGGDLADSGSSPVEIVDRIRALGWPGVGGNTDEMLAMPETLEAFAAQSPGLASLWTALREMAAATRAALGEERLAWLGRLPRTQVREDMALLHASPASTWRAPAADAPDAELESIYAATRQRTVVYGHIHRPYVRRLGDSRSPGRVIANAGSVGLSHDGDRRASYLLMDESGATVRRVEYDVDRELKALSVCGLPYSDWVAKILETAAPQTP